MLLPDVAGLHLARACMHGGFAKVQKQAEQLP